MQRKDKYAGKEENAGDKESILERRRLKAENLGIHEKLSLI